MTQPPVFPPTPWSNNQVHEDLNGITYMYINPPSVWRTLGKSAFGQIPMVSPDPPKLGDTRWNPLLDPPASSFDVSEMYTANKSMLVQGTNVTVVPNDSTQKLTINSSGGTDGPLDVNELYTANKSMLVQGTNVTVVPNDGTQKLTINSSASSTNVGAYTYLVATAAPYNLSTSGTAAANTTALKACINAAIGANKNVFIPAGRYTVNPGCLTPTLGSSAFGLEIWGEGRFRTELMMAPQATTSYFYDNGTNGETLRFASFRDMAFLGGPIETAEMRANVNANHNGFRHYGQPDQSFKFFRCRFICLNGVFLVPSAPNNASEIAFDNCKISHIQDYVWGMENLQSLNMNSINSDIEFIWGAIVKATGVTNGQAGGHLQFIGGSIIVQEHHSFDGSCVKVAGRLSGTISWIGCRFELRDPGSKLIDGTVGGQAEVNFISCAVVSITDTAVAHPALVITTNQVANFDMCTFEHSQNSWLTYTVNGTGSLMWDRCSVRSTLENEVTVSSPSGIAKARDCRVRYATGTVVSFTKRG